MKKKWNYFTITSLLLFSSIAVSAGDFDLEQPSRAGCDYPKSSGRRSGSIFNGSFNFSADFHACGNLPNQNLVELGANLERDTCSQIVGCSEELSGEEGKSAFATNMKKAQVEDKLAIIKQVEKYTSDEKFDMLGLMAYMKNIDEGESSKPFDKIKRCQVQSNIIPEKFICLINQAGRKNDRRNNDLVLALQDALRPHEGIVTSARTSALKEASVLNLNSNNISSLLTVDSAFLQNATESSLGARTTLRTQLAAKLSDKKYSYEEYFKIVSDKGWSYGGVVQYAFKKEQRLHPKITDPNEILAIVMKTVQEISTKEDLIPEETLPSDEGDQPRVDRFLAKINRIDAKLASHYLKDENCESYIFDAEKLCRDIRQQWNVGRASIIAGRDIKSQFNHLAVTCSQSFEGLNQSVDESNTQAVQELSAQETTNRSEANKRVADIIENDPTIPQSTKDRYASVLGTTSNSNMSRKLSEPQTKDVIDRALPFEKSSDPIKDLITPKEPTQESKPVAVNNSYVSEFNNAFAQDIPAKKETTSKNGVESNDNNSMASYYEKRLKDLDDREAALKKSIEQKAVDDKQAANDVELQELKKQLEALKTEKAKVAKESAKSAAIAAATAIRSNAANTSAASIGNSSAVTTKFNKPDEAQRFKTSATAQNESSSSQANGSQSRSPGPTSGKSSAAAVREGAAGNSGLVLTSNGDTAIDYSKIPENPKEADIMSLIEKSGGQSFLIRESGVLMKVEVEKGSDGKPLLVEGKTVFTKTRLKPGQEKQILKAVIVQRELKEVKDDPTRKYRLDQLMNSLKRP